MLMVDDGGGRGLQYDDIIIFIGFLDQSICLFQIEILGDFFCKGREINNHCNHDRYSKVGPLQNGY